MHMSEKIRRDIAVLDFALTFQVLDLLRISQSEDSANTKIIMNGKSNPKPWTKLRSMTGKKSMG